MSAIELLDLEDVEIVIAVERAFDIKISNAEAAGCHTVAGLFEVVASKVSNVDRGALPCPTASAFRRLRAALQAGALYIRVTSATRLAELFPSGRRRAWWRQLERSTDLAMPSLPAQSAALSGWAGPLAGAVLGCIVGGAAFIGEVGWWSVAPGTLALFAFGMVRERTYLEAISMGADATVGDLAKIAASLNAALLARPTGQMRRQEVWTALEGVIRTVTGYSGPIDKRTRFKHV